MYAFNAWWGFSNANDRHKTFAFIRRCIHTGFCSPDLADFHNLYISSDEKLFNQILTCYVMFSGVVLKIKVGIRYKHMWTRHRRREDRGAERGGVWVSPFALGGGAVPCIIFSLWLSKWWFWCILGRIFTNELLVYRLQHIMPVCVTDSETILRHKKRLNSLSCAFIFTSRRIPAFTLFIYDNRGEYMPSEITGGTYTA